MTGNRLSNYKNLRSQETTTGYLHLRWVFILIIAYLFHLRLVMGRRVFQGIVTIVLFWCAIYENNFYNICTNCRYGT